MNLKKIHIENYKSLVDLEIVEPNPFTVFAGPNGSGKSNIFEALEFMSYNSILETREVEKLFGGTDKIASFKPTGNANSISFLFDGFESYVPFGFVDVTGKRRRTPSNLRATNFFGVRNNSDYNERLKITEKIFHRFLRLFIGKNELTRIQYKSQNNLLPDASNCEPVIKKILATIHRDDFIDWLELFIPGFENIEIHSDNISGRDSLLIYEKGTKKPFDKALISDGTYNILCLLAAVYQSKEPQFLCIEEPENGLNPYVVRSLVEFFRNQCEEKGHYIWLNTHSATLVKELRPEELILVDKIDGATKIKQFSKNHNIYSLDMDDAWLSNALGGGIPW